MLTLKALHISLVVAWFAGLFYLPRIFVNLAMVPADSVAERERLLLMAGKLYRFMTPLGVLAVALGLWLWFGYGFSGGWLHAKTALVALLVIYHWHCGRILKDFRRRHQHEESCLVPLLQRDAGAGAVRRRLSRRAEAFLMNTYFAICPRGLEELLAEELRAVGGETLRLTHGGVFFSGDWSTCYRANLESRIATRILWHIVKGPYQKEEDIYRLAVRQLWPNHFAVSRTMRVVTTAIKCPLKSLDFVTLRVKDAVCDRFREDRGERPNIETRNPDVSIHVFLSESECTLYLDTSGQPLWQRGLRKASVDAPLKENLAAGILKLTGWQPGTPLVDPMCGSGTFLLEAVQIALDRAPGLDRGFAFELLASFEALNWANIRQAAEARVKPAEPLDIRGYDSDDKAVRATRRNLQEAGFGGIVTVDRDDLLDVQPLTETGIMVANPALRRAHRRAGRAGGLLSATRFGAEKALGGLELLLLHGRPASAQARRPQAEPQDAAVQRAARMPPVRNPHGGR